MPTTRSHEVHDKNHIPIHIGDTVSTKARGGKHAGEVSDIVTTKEEAARADTEVKNPPKVIFEDQHGHVVNHKPGTLVHGSNPAKPEMK